MRTARRGRYGRKGALPGRARSLLHRAPVPWLDLKILLKTVGNSCLA
jgi:hypothetical protein